MTIKQWLPLLGMTLSAFIFNTSEFMPIGLLTDIAHHHLCLRGHGHVTATDDDIFPLPPAPFASRGHRPFCLLPGII